MPQRLPPPLQRSLSAFGKTRCASTRGPEQAEPLVVLARRYLDSPRECGDGRSLEPHCLRRPTALPNQLKPKSN
ncbi:hypothetical protein [Azospirillum argentinense]|uniref:Uncharacterized protein n=1 Tax=Azospirillum brasilense TaxID=192 RepID=A0A4D8Q9H0_AZOBR|nr:hypothetical protein [Azospirillum argentinense]QCO07097.1 hypothetical protein D3867_35110 [Azospirillum argentinense]